MKRAARGRMDLISDVEDAMVMAATNMYERTPIEETLHRCSIDQPVKRP
jgi:hypothetical protein